MKFIADPKKTTPRDAKITKKEMVDCGVFGFIPFNGTAPKNQLL